jgi:2-polyprenyl-3-methyl-5-hydroxy-6-metoxy-1,4-benzoquinol methylase
MNLENNYLDINRKAWDEKVIPHINSEFYNQKEFLEGKNSLQKIELDILGDISQKSVLHLQCHFGQDSISMARLGANVVGVDFSSVAIENAKILAQQTQTNAEFICCDVYNLPQHLDQQFDIVFTSYGTIGWLPDLDRWASIISHFLNPNGKFIFVEFHPVVWIFDNDFKSVEYSYFKAEAIVENEEGTYADKSAAISPTTISWNHSLSEVFQSLIKNGLSVENFNEYDYSPYDCFNNTIETEPGKFIIANLGNKIPMVYSLVATKNK